VELSSILIVLKVLANLISFLMVILLYVWFKLLPCLILFRLKQSTKNSATAQADRDQHFDNENNGNVG